VIIMKVCTGVASSSEIPQQLRNVCQSGKCESFLNTNFTISADGKRMLRFLLQNKRIQSVKKEVSQNLKGYSKGKFVPVHGDV
jgi:hypothetical protein